MGNSAEHFVFPGCVFLLSSAASVTARLKLSLGFAVWLAAAFVHQWFLK